ncbi:GSCFA domain-containing protein [Methylobacterium sp. 77]|uniref:GSCFA domain-containing protein n=1 Tax=Methylobacterium sp. 77 TaxID=1101192 RepID=UPI00036BE6E0|nr:GSCFA domain-containing protein [Methylobacterium sp. 77]
MATIEGVRDGAVITTCGSYFRGTAPQWYPTDESLQTPDVVGDYLARGWMPKTGFVTKDTPIVAFGSCFASNVSNYLSKRGYSVISHGESAAYVTKMGDGMVHTHAILQQFRWAWTNEQPEVALWHGYKAERFGYDEEARLATKALFDRADLFIITLGLSEVWYDEVTGEVFWRAPPREVFDPSRHKFRLSRSDETKRNLAEIWALIRRFRPNAKVVLTISPIPLTATFRDVGCISANAVSKAILRGAVDEFYEDAEGKGSTLFYFPSYDMVMYGFDNQWTADRRHVYGHVLDFNMKVFEHYYCIPGLSKARLHASYRKARLLDLSIGRNGHAAVAKADPEVLAAQLAERRRLVARRRRSPRYIAALLMNRFRRRFKF